MKFRTNIFTTRNAPQDIDILRYWYPKILHDILRYYKLRHDFEVNRNWYPMENRYPMDLMSTSHHWISIFHCISIAVYRKNHVVTFLSHKQDFTKYINCSISIILPKGFHLDLNSLFYWQIYTDAILNLMNFELWPKFPDVLSKNYQKSQIKLSSANEIAYRRWVSNLAGGYQI
jgi:hypothetical protein